MIYFVAILSVVLLVGVDQLIKLLVINNLKPIEVFEFIPRVVRFHYVENTGAVFGSFATHTLVLTVISVILLVGTAVYFVKNKDKSKFVNTCLILMISGGIGNIIDRVRLHYVVDYIEVLFVDFAVFNFADCLITVGAFAMIFYVLFSGIKESKQQKQQVSADAEK